jgi:hypothetical protein
MEISARVTPWLAIEFNNRTAFAPVSDIAV